MILRSGDQKWVEKRGRKGEREKLIENKDNGDFFICRQHKILYLFGMTLPTKNFKPKSINKQGIFSRRRKRIATESRKTVIHHEYCNKI